VILEGISRGVVKGLEIFILEDGSIKEVTGTRVQTVKVHSRQRKTQQQDGKNLTSKQEV